MKKILLSCACCLLALGLVTACDDEVIDDGGVEAGGDEAYVLGVEVDGVLHYIDGGTVEGYAYEGTLTTDVSKAVIIDCESSGSTYYLSFDNAGVTNWVSIAVVTSESDGKEHTNLVYATEKSALYLHTTDAGAEYFGNEDGSYFLCFNSKYECFYASDISTYLASSPVAGLYTTGGKLVLGGKGGTTTSSGSTTEHGTPAPTLEATEVPEGAYGIFDFSQLSITSSTKAWTNGDSSKTGNDVIDGETYLAEAWKPADNTATLPCTITSTTNTYAGAGGTTSSNDAYQLSLQCMKFGNSSNGGTLVLNFDSLTVSKVEVTALEWNTKESATLKIADSTGIDSATAQEVTGDASDANAEIATYTFDGLSSSSIELLTSKRVLVFTMAIYTA